MVEPSPPIHIGPTADEEQVERDRIKNAGREKQLYGVAPEIMRAALTRANRKLKNEAEGKARKAKARKKGTAAKKARRANRKKR